MVGEEGTRPAMAQQERPVAGCHTMLLHQCHGGERRGRGRGRGIGNFFPPWNQVDLIFEKSGQPFYWALEFQIGAQKEIKRKKKENEPPALGPARHVTPLVSADRST